MHFATAVRLIIGLRVATTGAIVVAKTTSIVFATQTLPYLAGFSIGYLFSASPLLVLLFALIGSVGSSDSCDDFCDCYKENLESGYYDKCPVGSNSCSVDSPCTAPQDCEIVSSYSYGGYLKSYPAHFVQASTGYRMTFFYGNWTTDYWLNFDGNCAWGPATYIRKSPFPPFSSPYLGGALVQSLEVCRSSDNSDYTNCDVPIITSTCTDEFYSSCDTSSYVDEHSPDQDCGDCSGSSGSRPWIQIVYGQIDDDIDNNQISSAQGCWAVGYSYDKDNNLSIEYNPGLNEDYLKFKALKPSDLSYNIESMDSSTIDQEIPDSKHFDTYFWAAESVDVECRHWQPDQVFPIK